MSDEVTEQSSVPSAKTISKWVKLFCMGGLIACAVLKWVGVFTTATVTEMCSIWAVAYGLGAGTIDFNIIVDTLRGK